MSVLHEIDIELSPGEVVSSTRGLEVKFVRRFVLLIAQCNDAQRDSSLVDSLQTVDIQLKVLDFPSVTE
jgi:hypothetical protein